MSTSSAYWTEARTRTLEGRRPLLLLGILLVFALLWPRDGSVGLALCGVALASHLIYERWRNEEECSTWQIYATAAVRAARAGETEPAT